MSQGVMGDTTYTHDLNNRILTSKAITLHLDNQGNETLISTSNTTFTHDANGNKLIQASATINTEGTILENTTTQTNTYNSFNQLVGVVIADVNTTAYITRNPIITRAYYTYLPNGLRRSKAVTRIIGDHLLSGNNRIHIWDGMHMVAEMQPIGGNIIVTNRFIRGLGGSLIRSHIHGWYMFNFRGDVVQRIGVNTDHNSPMFGQLIILRTYQYDAFGNELNFGLTNTYNSNPFRFAAEYWDAETQTYYLRARHFNPRLGRFTQADPHWNIGNMVFGDSPTLRNNRRMPSVAAILQSGNLFVYTMGNPVFCLLRPHKNNVNNNSKHLIITGLSQ